MDMQHKSWYKKSTHDAIHIMPKVMHFLFYTQETQNYKYPTTLEHFNDYPSDVTDKPSKPNQMITE